jgi:hypothetical protein
MRVAIIEHFAAPHLTLCDYDAPQKPPALDRIMGIGRMIAAKPRAVEISKSRHGWHMVIAWDRDFEPAETIALQLLLGSDPNREALNLARVLTGIDSPIKARGWNLLFKCKVK